MTIAGLTVIGLCWRRFRTALAAADAAHAAAAATRHVDAHLAADVT